MGRLGSQTTDSPQRQLQSQKYSKQTALIALTERLQEQLVLELHIDGSRQYKNMTVRGLYRYVLTAITSNSGNNNAKSSGHMHHASMVIDSSTVRSAVIDEHPISDLKQIQSPFLQSSLLASPQTTRAATLHGVLAQSPTLPLPNLIGDEENQNNKEATVPQPPRPAAVSSEPITYRERLGGYLHPRDMRRMVTPFSTTNEPDLIVRRHVMLLNFDPLRAIILRDRLLVLVPDGTDSLLMHLEQRVRGGMDEVEDSVFGSDHDSGLNVTEHSSNNNNNNDESDNNSKHNSSSQHGKSNRMGAASSLISKILLRPSSRDNSNDHEENLKSEHGSNRDDNSKNKHGGTVADDDDDALSEMDEWHEMEAREWIQLPFELQCADAVLHVVGHMLTEETMELQEEAQSNIDKLLQYHSSGAKVNDPLTIIRDVKDKVQLMAARVKGYAQSLNRILDEDKDMALMNLSRLLTHPERFIQPVPQQVLEEESNEPELILEANLQVAMTLQNNLNLIHGKVSTAKELIDQKQDATRNRLLLANMLISVLMLCVTMIAAVGAFFGMNVPNPLHEMDLCETILPQRDDTGAFETICWASTIGAVFMCMFIMFVLYQTGTIDWTPPSNMAIAHRFENRLHH